MELDPLGVSSSPCWTGSHKDLVEEVSPPARSGSSFLSRWRLLGWRLLHFGCPRSIHTGGVGVGGCPGPLTPSGLYSNPSLGVGTGRMSCLTSVRRCDREAWRNRVSKKWRRSPPEFRQGGRECVAQKSLGSEVSGGPKFRTAAGVGDPLGPEPEWKKGRSGRLTRTGLPIYGSSGTSEFCHGPCTAMRYLQAVLLQSVLSGAFRRTRVCREVTPD